MKKNQQEINEIIEGRARILAGILSEIRMWDVKEVQEIISIHMKDTLAESLKPAKENIKEEFENEKEGTEKNTLKENLKKRQIEIYKKINKLQEVVLSPSSVKQKRKESQKEVALLKQELKRVNISLNSIQDEEEYVLFKKFVFKNYGEFILREFYKTIPKRKKSKISFD